MPIWLGTGQWRVRLWACIVFGCQYTDPKTNLDVRKSLEKHKLFVTDIPLYVVEEDLCEYFSQWGNISFCDVEGRSNQRTRHIFVSYTNKEDALACLNTTHNYGESEINVLVATHCKALSDASKAGNNVAGSRFQTRKNSLFVSNVPDDASLEELTEHFSMWGEVISYTIGGRINPDNNFGFVRYKEQEDALRAVIMPHTMKNQRVFVQVSERKSRPLLRASKDPEVMAAIHEKTKNCYLYVPFLNPSTTEEELYEHFKVYGSLAFLMIIPNSTNMKIGHLAFAKEADAVRCFNEDHFLNEDYLTVRWSDRTRWGGEDTRGLVAGPASPPDPPSPPKHKRHTGRRRHKRRAGRRRRNRHGHPPRHTDDDDLDYPSEAEIDLDDGCDGSWNC